MAILWPEPAATRKLFPTFFLQRLGMERPAYGPPLPGAGGNQDGVSNFFSSGSDWKGLPAAGASGDQDDVSNFFSPAARVGQACLWPASGRSRPRPGRCFQFRWRPGCCFQFVFSSTSEWKGLPLAGASGDRDVVANFFPQRLGMERLASGRSRRRPGRCFQLFFSGGSDWKGVGDRFAVSNSLLQRFGLERLATGRSRWRPGRCFQRFSPAAQNGSRQQPRHFPFLFSSGGSWKTV